MTTTPANVSVQRIAKHVLADLVAVVGPDSTEETIVSFAVDRLSDYGVTDTWYYDCPALVLLGGRSCLSVSGRDYRPCNERVGRENVVTVDLSPIHESLWGDCARTFVIEDGKVVDSPAKPEFRRGIDLLKDLHSGIREFVTVNTRFCDVHEFANDTIAAARFENLDFLGNVGHSIVSKLADREFIDRNNTHPLHAVGCFTFEPHVREAEGKWGFKHEEIYYFDQAGCLGVL